MKWAVVVRGIATQKLYVEANSASEARRKAGDGHFEDADPMDWEQDADGNWLHGAARDYPAEPLEEIPYAPSGREPW